MTIQLVGVVQHFIGVAADVKPTAGVPVGSTFYETDTKARYVFNAGAWTLQTQEVSLATALSSSIDSVDIPKLASAAAGGDAMANPTTAPVLAHEMEWNGSTWQRRRGGEPVTVLASAARTATINSSDITIYNGRGLVVFVDITAYTAGGLVVKIQAKDPVSLKYVDVLTSASLAAVATTRLVVYPGVTVAANLAASDVLSRAMRVRVEHADATSITYSVGAVVLQ